MKVTHTVENFKFNLVYCMYKHRHKYEAKKKEAKAVRNCERVLFEFLNSKKMKV